MAATTVAINEIAKQIEIVFRCCLSMGPPFGTYLLALFEQIFIDYGIVLPRTMQLIDPRIFDQKTSRF